MKTDDKPAESKVVVGAIKRRRLRAPNMPRLRKYLPLIVVGGAIVIALGGFLGTKWYRQYQLSQAEKKYQATLTQLTDFNKQGKSKAVIDAAEKYLNTKPAAKYQLRPKYFLALAYLGTNQTEKAKSMLEQQLADPLFNDADRMGVLSALITIARTQKDTVNGEKYLPQMIEYLQQKSKLPENQRFKVYYQFEIQRYQMYLDSLRKMKQ